jgi:hypothetical protein
MLAAAGALEVSGHKSQPDPMGNDYEGVDGTLGWRAETDGGVDLVSGFAYGANRIGCNLQRDAGRMAATCPDTVTIYGFQQDRVVYRLCARGTPRMSCRMAWEKVHDGMRSPAYGPAGYSPPVVYTVPPAVAPAAKPVAAPPATPVPDPDAPTSEGGWF